MNQYLLQDDLRLFLNQEKVGAVKIFFGGLKNLKKLTCHPNTE